MVGGFSSAFDLISSEYGWTNEYILDNLTLARMQQIVSAIKLRKFASDRTRRKETAWMSRNIASFIAAGYFSEDNSKAVEAASKITMDEIDAKILETVVLAPAEPELREGGFERLKMAFGGMAG